MSELVERFVSAYNKADVSLIISLFTEQAVLMPPNEPHLVGRDAIGWRFQIFFDSFTFDLDLHSLETSLTGELGFERGTYRAFALPKEGGVPRGGEGEYMFAFEVENGSWKISAFGTSASESHQQVSSKVSHWESGQTTDWHYKWASTLADTRRSKFPPEVFQRFLREATGDN